MTIYKVPITGGTPQKVCADFKFDGLVELVLTPSDPFGSGNSQILPIHLKNNHIPTLSTPIEAPIEEELFNSCTFVSMLYDADGHTCSVRLFYRIGNAAPPGSLGAESHNVTLILNS